MDHQRFNGELQTEQLALIAAELRRFNNLFAHFIAQQLSPADTAALELVKHKTEAVLHQADTMVAQVKTP